MNGQVPTRTDAERRLMPEMPGGVVRKPVSDPALRRLALVIGVT